MISKPQSESSPGSWERWKLTSFNDVADTVTAKVRVAVKREPLALSQPRGQETVHLREAARQEGYQAGFDAGRAEGLRAGQEAAEAAGRKLAAQLAQAISRLDAGVAELEHTVADELLALALEIARKVIQQTVAVHPQVVLGVIRQALAQLPVQHAMIHLNAEDAALVRGHAGEQLAHGGHRIQDDAQLARGDVVIESGGAHLNARLATRWQQVIAALGDDTPWLAAEDAERA